MRLLITFGTTFLSAAAACLVCMLVMSFFQPHAIKPWITVGIAAGISVAMTIRAKRPAMSTESFALLVGCLVGIGVAIGNWMS
jgi:flagellar biosynthesis protein FliR